MTVQHFPPVLNVNRDLQAAVAEAERPRVLAERPLAVGEVAAEVEEAEVEAVEGMLKTAE